MAWAGGGGAQSERASEAACYEDGRLRRLGQEKAGSCARPALRERFRQDLVDVDWY